MAECGQYLLLHDEWNLFTHYISCIQTSFIYFYFLCQFNLTIVILLEDEYTLTYTTFCSVLNITHTSPHVPTNLFLLSFFLLFYGIFFSWMKPVFYFKIGKISFGAILCLAHFCGIRKLNTIFYYFKVSHNRIKLRNVLRSSCTYLSCGKFTVIYDYTSNRQIIREWSRCVCLLPLEFGARLVDWFLLRLRMNRQVIITKYLIKYFKIFSTYHKSIIKSVADWWFDKNMNLKEILIYHDCF